MEEQRLLFWDNCKGLLIFLVVLGHYYGTGMVYAGDAAGLWRIPTGIYTFIYLFHMPLFSFISGYFSRNTEKCRDRAAAGLLLPYLLFNTLYVLLDGERVNPLFAPYGPMWYPLALYLWRMLAKDGAKIRGGFFWAVGFALVSSVLSPGKNYVFLNNAITFFPFFLLGLTIRPQTIDRLRSLPRWVFAGGILLAAGGVGIGLGVFGLDYLDVCFFARNYPLGVSSIKYLGADLGRYAIALVLGGCVLGMIPEKKTFLAPLGTRTMPVLLFHSVPHFRDFLFWLNPFAGNFVGSMVYWTGLSGIVTGALGSAAVSRLYRRGMDRVKGLVPRRLPHQRKVR